MENINPLYLSNLKEFIKQKRFTITEIAPMIGFTVNGLHTSIKNDTLKVRDLQKIADILNINVEKMFQNINTDKPYLNESGTQVSQEGNSNSNKINSENNTDSKLKTENKFLKDKVKNLEEIIEGKNEIINLLKGK